MPDFKISEFHFTLVSNLPPPISVPHPMKRLLPVCLVVWFADIALLRAGPVETAIVAAMRLSDQPNYSWTATVTDDARTYYVDGKTVRGGFTFVKMPVINSVRRRLGRSVTDTQIEMIFRGNVDCVLATDEGWRKPDNFPPPDDELDEDAPMGTVGSSIPGLGSIPGGVMKGTVIRQRRPRPVAPEERHYSNLQLAISHPHEELGVIVSSHREFKIEDDNVTGTLTDLGAQLLLVHDGQKEITPLLAAGTFKLWLRDGMVAKYQVRLEGVLEVETPKGRRKIVVHQNTETLLKDVGTTKFEVPEQARKQLSR
jgi:hypothetical protein